ncbi:MAG: polyprenyl synthetase family protein [Bacteroidota bacterium]
MKTYKELYTAVETQISSLSFTGNPQNLYDPIGYMLSLGGKRLRPVLCLMANDMFGGEAQHAMPAALAVEVFHNFTLVHDDIMDNAPIRRGKPTVHEKWNQTIAILSGDLMMIKAIDLLVSTQKTDVGKLIQIFNKAAAEVCEGQQLDMNFENLNEVQVQQYLDMITLKTAVLLGASLKLGATIAGATDDDAEKLYLFGKHIGVAFQIQDDLLDAFGEGDKVGKKIGGDIAANKKTLLWIEALRLADASDKDALNSCIGMTNEKEKINKVIDLYKKLGVLEVCEQLKKEQLQLAFAYLDAISVGAEKKQVLKNSAIELMERMS